MKKIRRKIYNLSKKTGDRYGFDLVYFVENGFWMVLNQSFVLFFGLVVSVLFARYFSKEVYGQYQLILSIIGFFSFFSISGLNASLIRNVAKGFDGDYKKSVKVSFLYSLIGSVVIIIISAYYFIQGDSGISKALMAAAIMFPFLLSFDKWQAILKGKAKFDVFTKEIIIQMAGKSLLIIAAILFFQNELLPVILAYLLGTAFFNIFLYRTSFKYIENNKTADDTFSYGMYITKLGILNTLVNHFDKIIVGFLDIRLLAVYTIALGLINIIKNFVKSITAITFPKFAKHKIFLNFKQYAFLFISGLIITIILFITAEDLVRILYTEKYLSSVRYFKFFILIIPLFLISSILSKKVLAEKSTQVLFHLKLTVPLVTLFVSVLSYILSRSVEVFVLTKFFVFNTLNFLILLFSNK